MSTQLHDALDRIADRGEWRGADGLLEAAMAEAQGHSLVTARAPSRRPLPGLAVAAVAAAVVVLVLGSVALWATMRPESVTEPTDTTAVTTTLAPTTTVAPTTTEAAGTTTTTTPPELAVALPWVFEEIPEPMGWHWDVAVGPVGAVTASGDSEPVDIDFDGDGEPDEINFPAVWYSPDLADWTLVRLPIDSDTGCDEGWREWRQTTDVEAGPLGYIALGLDECNSTAWTSDDAITWDRIVHPEWEGNPQALRSVTAGGPGWVAVGSDLRGNGAVWVSSDGREWQRIEDDDLLWADRPVDTWDVKAGGPGLVVVGIEGGETSDAVSAVWISPDGFAWERLPNDAVGGAGLFYLSVDPQTGRMVTFSRPPTDRPLDITPGQAWTSTDGRTWTGSSVPAAPVTGHAIWDGDAILAVSRGQDGGDPELWLSQDAGLTWHLIEGPEGVLNPTADYAPFGIERFGDEILIVGQCDDCSGVWLGQPTD